MSKIHLSKGYYIIFFLAFSLFNTTLSAQEKLTISGYINDAYNGESLIGATVYVQENQSGTVTKQPTLRF